MDLILLLRLAYLSAAAAILLINFVPALHDRFLAYGPRAVAGSATPTSKERALKETNTFSVLLDRLADIKVPHSWFTSFYVVLLLASFFWAAQIFTRGSAFRSLANLTGPQEKSTTYKQVLYAWLLFTGHGTRRLYESFAVSKPSQSRMWFGHWLLGIGFYLATSVALWVEGIPALQSHTLSSADLKVELPPLRFIMHVILFLAASVIQHSCHAYLASLKSTSKDKSTYKLPQHPAFNTVIAPHYMAECILYMALAYFTAPERTSCNYTMFCALIFVAVNLGVTADGTRSWYQERFGQEAVAGKWRMIIGVW